MASPVHTLKVTSPPSYADVLAGFDDFHDYNLGPKRNIWHTKGATISQNNAAKEYPFLFINVQIP